VPYSALCVTYPRTNNYHSRTVRCQNDPQLPAVVVPPRAFPTCPREELRGLVKVPHPSVVAKDFDLLDRQRAQLSRTNIGVDVAQRTHAGDDRRDGGVRKAVPQSYFGEAFDRGTEVFSDCLDAFPDLLFSVAAKVAVAPVTFGELGLRVDVAGQSTLVKGHPDYDTDLFDLYCGE